jgi:hemoglobin-like flavoprotein
MKALLVMIAALIGVACAGDGQKCCSVEDRREVLNFWESVWGAQFSGRRVIIAQNVFKALFRDFPAAKGLFSRVNVDDVDSAEFKSHCVRVINGLDVAINLLDDPASLKQQLDHLHSQHLARKGVKAEYFQYIGRAFAEVMPKGATCFNPDAWGSCFNYIANAISNGLP